MLTLIISGYCLISNPAQFRLPVIARREWNLFILGRQSKWTRSDAVWRDACLRNPIFFARTKHHTLVPQILLRVRAKVHLSIPCSSNLSSQSIPIIVLSTMPPPATPKSPAKTKLSPMKLDPPPSTGPAIPDKVVIKSKNNVLETTSPNTQLATKLDAMSLASPAGSPTKRVYHAPLTKENRSAQAERPQIAGRTVEDEPLGMSEQAKKSLRSINALRGLNLDEIEIVNKPNVKRLATVTQLCTFPFNEFRS